MTRRGRAASGALAIAIAAVTLVRAQTSFTPPAVALPFTVSLGEPFQISGLGGLHSYAFGTLGDRVLLVGGRTVGLHGFSKDDTNDNFIDTGANRSMWVVDLAARRATGVPLTPFEPPLLRDVLSATNHEFVQEGNNLYVVGGYGVDSQDKQFTTFPSLTVIDVQRAMDYASAAGGTALVTPFARVYSDERFRVTGGALFLVNHQFFLVFGQVFDRAYTPALKTTASFTQIYTESVRMFTMGGTPVTPTWQASIPTAPPLNHDYYHRRDFPSALTIGPTGAPRLTAFGGVFRMGSPDPHMDVVNIDGLDQAAGPTIAQNALMVAMNQYVCPTLTLTGGAAAGRAFTIFFGGLSLFRYDSATMQLVPNTAQTDHGPDGMGFVDDISGVVLNGTGPSGFVLDVKMPGLLGTSASLIPRPGFENGLVDLSTIAAPTTVGYIFGGIVSTALHAGAAGTRASNLFIPVIVSPAPSSAHAMPPIPLTPLTP